MKRFERRNVLERESVIQTFYYFFILLKLFMALHLNLPEEIRDGS